LTEHAIILNDLNKKYGKNFYALKNLNLSIPAGVIFAILGPNGAGKTTLINIICGLVNKTSGNIKVLNDDIDINYKSVRSKIGLVPQELYTDMFETVSATVDFSRGIFGLKQDAYLKEKVLKDLSLTDKKFEKIANLSGGMKRRVLIAKALIHEPKILFLDEPTAGVDIEIRKSIWEMVNSIKKSGVTIILTSHYLQEVEEISDMISVIKDGEIKITDTKKNIFDKFSDKKYIFYLDSIPNKKIELGIDYKLDYEQKTLQISQKNKSIGELLKILSNNKIKFNDIQTNQSNLEDSKI
jgi:ABC-2 type transport system ATP-binding protein